MKRLKEMNKDLKKISYMWRMAIQSLQRVRQLVQGAAEAVHYHTNIVGIYL